MTQENQCRFKSRPSGEEDLGARREIYWIEISNEGESTKAITVVSGGSTRTEI